MTEQELQALISLLNRTPMTPAETLWINDLLRRLRPQPAQVKAEANARDLD